MATEDSTTIVPFIGNGRVHRVKIDVDECWFSVVADKENLIDLGLIREQSTANGQKRLYVTAKTSSRNFFTILRTPDELFAANPPDDKSLRLFKVLVGSQPEMF